MRLQLNIKPKRIGFVSIQNAHTLSSDGYQQPIIRTGYEYLMPYKVGALYCVTAEEDGVVTAVTDKLISIEYKSGQKKSYRIGFTYGRMEGSCYKHELVTELIAGKRFKKGDYILYNTGFFEKDWLNQNRLVMKFGRVVTTAFTMSNEVYEDSSAISPELSKTMSTTHIKERIFVRSVKENIVDILPEGQKVSPNDVLFVIVDENADYTNLSASSIEKLKSISAVSPKAKTEGSVFRYEIKYNADFSDMSPSVKKLITRLDKEIFEETKGTSLEVKNNRVTSEYRSEGKNLLPGTFELKVFIENKISMGVADKGVFGNQAKSVVSETFSSNITTESGEKVDAMFSFRSVLNRTVLSPQTSAVVNRVVKKASKTAADIYFG